MALSQSAITPESAMAAQNRLSELEAQQRAHGQKLAEVEVTADRQRELERRKQGEMVIVGEYRIRPGDVISVFVFKHTELSKEKVLVQPDGRISTPLVQSLPAAGFTPAELKAAIEKSHERRKTHRRAERYRHDGID
jgi:protein involved in polysaccharide export with SLBB domain